MAFSRVADPVDSPGFSAQSHLQAVSHPPPGIGAISVYMGDVLWARREGSVCTVVVANDGTFAPVLVQAFIFPPPPSTRLPSTNTDFKAEAENRSPRLPVAPSNSRRFFEPLAAPKVPAA